MKKTKTINKIKSLCEPFKKNGLKTKKINNLLNSLIEKEFDNEEGVYSENKIIVQDNENYTLTIGYIDGKGFIMIYSFDKTFKKKDIKLSNLIAKINNNILTMTLDINDKLTINEKIGFEKEEMNKLNLHSLHIECKKRKIIITLDELPF